MRLSKEGVCVESPCPHCGKQVGAYFNQYDVKVCLGCDNIATQRVVQSDPVLRMLAERDEAYRIANKDREWHG